VTARRRRPARLLGTLAFVATACGGGGRALDADLGGDTTRHSDSRVSFSFPAPNLSDAERGRFEVGDSFFTKNWVAAPSSTDARDGLGPTFNAQACSSCHVLDGRGAPPDLAGTDARLGLLLRLSVPGETATGAPAEHPVYGGQLQDRAILDVPAEGRVDVTRETIRGTYADGIPYGLTKPTYAVADPAFGPLGDDTMISPRLAPQVIGMGLLEAVPDAVLLDAADPDDTDGDGISGRPNLVRDARSGERVVGRFGWKANVTTVEQQVAGAFHGDIGITSTLHPDENCPAGQATCAASPSGGSPELADDRLAAVTFYGRTLAVPAMRDVDDDAVEAGSEVFEALGCTACHTPTLTTGDADIAALSDQTIHPYTDLLLHDMGSGLADGRPDFEATGSEWRTPPLWGLGVVDDVNGQRFLLHDGRATTFEEAILWHGGEGAGAAEAFRTASADDRAKLLAFLEAL
jgi:CxxC motif-containing protein (DUF1111 family)